MSDDKYFETTVELVKSWQMWAHANGVEVGTIESFEKRLEKEGHTRYKDGFLGIRLKSHARVTSQ